MQCQYSAGCTKIGVHSCSSCGNLVCGKHAPITGSRVRCEDCDLPIRQAEARQAQELERRRQVEAQEQEKRRQAWENAPWWKKLDDGCITAMVGLGILVFGAILCPVIGTMSGGGAPTPNTPLWIAGIVVFIGIVTIVVGARKFIE
jgi:hypothetical protein